MPKFRIQKHGRLQELIAHEKGYFTDEGLDYGFSDFVSGDVLGPIVEQLKPARPPVVDALHRFGSRSAVR